MKVYERYTCTADGTITVLDTDFVIWFSSDSQLYEGMLREVEAEEATITEKTVPPEEE